MRPATATATAKRFGIALVVVSVILGAWAPASQAQWDVSAEFLYWQPVGTGVNFGVVREGFDPTGSERFGGQVKGIDHGFSPGVRLTAGWDPWRLSWTYLRSTESFSEACPDLITPCFGALTGGDSFDERGFTANARSRLIFHMGDLDYRSVLATTANLVSHWLFGFRYARFDDRRAMDFLNDEGTQTVKIRSVTNAFGLHAGLDGRLRLFRNVDVEGKLGVSTLVGRSDSNFALFQIESRNFQRNRERLERTVFVPAIETGLRLVWTPIKQLDIMVGYEFLNFWNVWTHQVHIFGEDVSGEFDRNVGFHGPTAGLKWRF